jgi:predicted amidohydrolase YtcJ
VPAADLVIQGTVCTVDERQPTAEALAVSDGGIVAGSTARSAPNRPSTMMSPQ